MKLVVGLGNPGIDYDNTRHNVGFKFLDYYLDYKDFDVKWSKKNEGLYFQTFINGEKVIFLKPQTYMNLSGNCVKKYLDYFDISCDDLLVISDDLDLMIGNYKLREKGSCGGHNGLRDIEAKIGTDNYKRLKIGISKDQSLDTKDYVLGVFSKEEKNILLDEFNGLCSTIDDYFGMPFGDLMSKYNHKNK